MNDSTGLNFQDYFVGLMRPSAWCNALQISCSADMPPNKIDSFKQIEILHRLSTCQSQVPVRVLLQMLWPIACWDMCFMVWMRFCALFPHCCFTDLLIQAGIPRATLSKLLTLADAANGLQSFPASLRWAQQHAWTCQSSFEVWHRKKLLTKILLWVFFLGSVFFLVFTAFWGFQR